MKSVLRSCLDPLPRFLSLRGLTALVGMLVLGVVFSVWEFVESAQMPEHRVLANDSSWSAPCCARASASCGSTGANAMCTPCPAQGLAPAEAQAQSADPPPPSVFDPSRARSGG